MEEKYSFAKVRLPLGNSFGWLKDAEKLLFANDLIVFSQMESDIVRFGASFKHYLANRPNTQICTIYGALTITKEDFFYQISRTLPESMLLPFSTENVVKLMESRSTSPQMRYYIWFDADFTFKNNKRDFKELFWLMNGISQQYSLHKYDGSTGSRNVFLFSRINEKELQYLFNKAQSVNGNLLKIEGLKLSIVEVAGVH